jgi:uroporphyrinogen-III synthase
VTAALIVITRPRPAGGVLAAALRASGSDALCCPAFDLLPSAEPQALDDALTRLASFDLVVFVSPAAVHALAAALPRISGTGVWPPATSIAAMGAATRAAVLAQVEGAERVPMLCPAGDTAADGGSEALWPLVRAQRPPPRRVLIVRAQGGRQWLSEQLAGTGVAVEEIAAYQRLAHVPTAPESAALHAATAAGHRLAILYSSAEAIDVVAQQLGHDAALTAPLVRQIGLCVHERIAAALSRRGCKDVRLCAPEVEPIRRALNASIS